jgi:hypothetical protein
MKRIVRFIGMMTLVALAGYSYGQIELRDNPFSDAIARSNALVFDVADFVTLGGTITGEIIHINRGPAYYFRTEVKDDNSRTSVWAVLVRVNSPQEIAKLKPGTPVRIRGNRAKDGSFRLVALPVDITITPR